MLTIEEIRNIFFFIFQIKACFYSNFVKSEQVSHRQKKKKKKKAPGKNQPTDSRSQRKMGVKSALFTKCCDN